MSLSDYVALRDRIAELEELVRALQMRLNALEGERPKAEREAGKARR